MNKEDTIREHCRAHLIRITERPSGSLRFIGHEIDVTFAGWEHVNMADLQRYDPPPKRQARAWMTA